MDNFKLAKSYLLDDSGIEIDFLANIIGDMFVHKLDYADLYFQYQQIESWALEDGIVKEASFHFDKGVGVRAVAGEKTGFAYSDVINKDALQDAAAAARSIIKDKGPGNQTKVWNKSQNSGLYMPDNPLKAFSENEKVQLLQMIDQEARKIDPMVKKVSASLSGAFEVILIMASDGTLATDIRPLVRINVTVIAEKNGRREQGFAGGGGRYHYHEFLKDDNWKNYVHEAVRLATVNLEATDAPAGTMDVVLGSGWPGVLLHEAIGHGLEGDFNRKETSAFCDLMGKEVASPLCTIVDDGTLANCRGSLTVDDEGTPTQKTVLIENGILKNFMMDKLNAKLMNTKSTGNCRRESYAHIPMPRMTNTYMLPGKHDPKEIIASIDRGIYAVNFGGGQVDITSGKFVFVMNEAYMIENGKITHPVKGATLIGDGPSALKQVSMVGNDLALDDGIGICGKEGQSIPVGVGQPTLRINGLTVGGTNT